MEMLSNYKKVLLVAQDGHVKAYRDYPGPMTVSLNGRELAQELAIYMVCVGYYGDFQKGVPQGSDSIMFI